MLPSLVSYFQKMPKKQAVFHGIPFRVWRESANPMKPMICRANNNFGRTIILQITVKEPLGPSLVVFWHKIGSKRSLIDA